MRMVAIPCCRLGLAAVLAAAPTLYGAPLSRNLRFGSQALFGLMKNRRQNGTVTVRAPSGAEFTLKNPGDCVLVRELGDYRLEFNQDAFDLNFMVVASDTPKSAYKSA